MATSKVITLTDITQGRLYIDPLSDGNLTVQRDYSFVSGDPLVAELSDRAFAAVVPWADVPANIQQALIDIDAWTYEQILESEDMT